MPCKYDGRQRPVDVTCCERCKRFPRCMPPGSPELKASIRNNLQAGAVERDTLAALLDTLEAALRDDSITGETGD